MVLSDNSDKIWLLPISQAFAFRDPSSNYRLDVDGAVANDTHPTTVENPSSVEGDSLLIRQPDYVLNRWEPAYNPMVSIVQQRPAWPDVVTEHLDQLQKIQKQEDSETHLAGLAACTIPRLGFGGQEPLSAGMCYVQSFVLWLPIMIDDSCARVSQLGCT